MYLVGGSCRDYGLIWQSRVCSWILETEFRYCWRSRRFHLARFSFLICGFRIQNLEPILISSVGGSCNEFVLIRRTRACLVDTETSSFLFNELFRFMIVASYFPIAFFCWQNSYFLSTFSVTLTQRFRNSIIGIFSLPGFCIRRTSNLDSCFLSTFSVTSCSEIKLSELFVGLILLFGRCSSVSCWFLLMAIRNFLVTRC